MLLFQQLRERVGKRLRLLVGDAWSVERDVDLEAGCLREALEAELFESMSRSISPTCAHSRIAAGAQGSRSNTIIVGRWTFLASDSEVCNSRSARFDVQRASAGRRRGRSRSSCRSPSPVPY